MLIVAVQPVHDGLRTAAGAFCNLCRTLALDDIVQSKQSLAGAGMGGIQGHVAKLGRGLSPALIINA